MSRRQLLVGVVLAACMAAPGAAAAQTTSVSQDELADLTTRARIDPAALEELRTIEEVDGARVDLEGALEGADRSEIGSRLDALAGNAGVVAPGGDIGAGRLRAQRAARERLRAQPRRRAPSSVSGVSSPPPFPGPWPASSAGLAAPFSRCSELSSGPSTPSHHTSPGGAQPCG